MSRSALALLTAALIAGPALAQSTSPNGVKAIGPPPGMPDPLRDIKKGMPPALVLIGSVDEFLPACQNFCAKGRELGARMEIEVYEGQPHAFFNRPPWMEKTIERTDRFLEATGFLAK